ncbi:MAG: carbohydrate ABC transporter permease [Chloroflexi bacterium]|nr:carbohydrate ABC transporter permease [Chloroflexota bacterium]
MDKSTTTASSVPLWQRISITQILMYTVLILYALLSVFPFLFMLSTSLMTTGEATSKRSLIPGKGYQIDTTNDFTPCILYTKDTFIDADGNTVTQNRFIVDISDEALVAQQYSNYSKPAYESRQEYFRIPFFTNYCAAWQQGRLGKYMWNSIKITVISVMGTIIFATLAAYAFARMQFAGKELLFAILLSTLMIPGIVQTLPNVILVTKIGEIFGSEGWFAQNLGFSFCGDRNCWINNWPALTIPFMAPAVSIFLLRQHFQSVPDELWDAARIDGAGHLRFLIQIVLPISKSALFVILLFAFIGSWNELAWPLLVTAGNDEWRPIAAGLQAFFNEEARLPQLQMAGSMIAIFPVLILYAITQRTFIEGLSQSGLKG